MPDSTAAAASTATSDSAVLSVFIILNIISIMTENLSEKFFILTIILIGKSHPRKSRLHENAAIK